MGIGRGNCQWAAQVPGVRSYHFGALAFFEFCETLYAVGGDYRRRFFDHRKPWYRPTYRAEIAGGAKSTAVGAGVALEWSGGLFSVWVVSFSGRDAVCVLPGSVGRIWAGGQDLSDIHRERDAAWDCGAVDRSDSGGGDVELERGAELSVIEFDYGFLSSFSPGGRRSGAAAVGAIGNGRVGAGAVRTGGAGAASGGARGGSRAADCFGCLRGAAGSLSVGSADQAR